MTAFGLPIANLPNVFFDPASAYPWTRLCETTFIRRLFHALAAHCGNEFDRWSFYIFSAHDAACVPASASVRAERKVLMFLSDESCSVPSDLRGQFHAIFKSYLPGEVRGSNIYPLPLGYVDDVPELPVVPMADRTVDVFFSGNLHRSRLGLWQALHPAFRCLPQQSVKPILRVVRRCGWPRLRMDFSSSQGRRVVHFTDAFRSGMGPSQYAHMLANSKIVLCPRGITAAETFRHIEALRAGAIVVSDPLPKTRFWRDAPIITVNGWKEGLAAVDELMKVPVGLLELQQRGLAWWREVLSEQAVARYIAGTLGMSAT